MNTAYGMRALAAELDKLARAQPGERNTTLNTVWIKLCQHITVRNLDYDHAYQLTYDTARQIGLGDTEIRKTMASAEKGAATHPRPISTPSQPPNPHPSTLAIPSMALEFETLAELRKRIADAGPRQWLLRGIWPAADYGVHAAEMKAQKTWNATDLAISVASGTPWLNTIDVDHPGPVTMFHGEGSDANLARRLDAICVSRQLDPNTLPIHICTRAPKLNDHGHLQLMHDQINNTQPTLIILDPFYLSARGANTRDLVEMGGLLETAQHLCQDAGAALLVVTHHNRNTSASGALRITGAGPAEWGRVLITAEVKTRRLEAATQQTTVTTELTVIGGEVAGGAWRVVRKIRADNPDDLNSPLHYEVTAHEKDDHAFDADNDMPPARRALLESARHGPSTIKELVDRIVDNGGIPLRRETCSRELNILLKSGLIDCVQHMDRGKLWMVTPERSNGPDLRDGHA